MVNTSNRRNDRTPVRPENVRRHRTNARGVVIGLAAAAVLLALGFAMLQREEGPSSGDLDPAAGSIGPSEPRRDAGKGDDRVSEMVRSGGGHPPDASSRYPATEATLPPDVLDRNAEYIVEDGMIVPQRVAPSSALPSGEDDEPSVPQGSPAAVATPDQHDMSVPAGIAGPLVVIPGQQVPGEHGLATDPPVTVPADTGEAPAQQIPRL